MSDKKHEISKFILEYLKMVQEHNPKIAAELFRLHMGQIHVPKSKLSEGIKNVQT